MAAVIAKAKMRNKQVLLTENIFEQTAFWGLCLLLFFSPFFRGLFFPQEQRVALIAAAAIFWLVCLAGYQRKNLKLHSSSLDCLILGLPLVYIVSAFGAANYALAVDEVIKNLLYFLVFWSATRVINRESDIEKIFIVTYLCAIGVSLAGLFTASGFIDIKDGFLTSDGGTIASTFQYKNTLASFLTASIFIGTYLWGKQNSCLQKIVLIAGNFLLLTVLFSTQSHGGYIVFGIFTVVLWFLTPAPKRLGLIINTLALIVFGFIESRLFLASIADRNIGLAWFWLIGGAVLISAGQWAAIKYIKNRQKPPISFRQLVIATVIAFAIGLAVMGATGMFQILSEKIHAFGAMERLTMYQDSLKMIKEKPLLGWGGGGWSEAYSIFQGYGYTSRQTHSYFLQLAIETGLPGLFIALSIWGVFLIRAVKIYKACQNNSRNQTLAAALICAVLAIIAHALFDFDLSLSALTIVMFTLMACLLSLDKNVEAVQAKTSQAGCGYKLAASTAALLVIMTVSLTLISARQYSDAALEAINVRNGDKALVNIEKSISLNPLATENVSLAAQLQMALGNRDKAIEYGKKSAALARYNPDRQVELSLIYLRANQNEEAVAAINQAVALAPLKTQYYEQLANVLTNAAINELKAERFAAAANYAKQTLAIPGKINKVLDTVSPDKKKLWIYAQPLTVTSRIKLNLGTANLLLGNFTEADMNILEAARDPQVQKDILVWQALLAQKQGDQNKAQEILQNAEKDNPDIKKQYALLSSLKLITK